MIDTFVEVRLMTSGKGGLSAGKDEVNWGSKLTNNDTAVYLNTP